MTRKPSRGKSVDIQKCIELYKSGLSMNKVGELLGHHHSVIKYHLLRNNIPTRPRNESQRKPIKNEFIANLYNEGMSAVEIGQKLNITYQCVYDRLAEMGIKTRNRREQIKMMIQRGTYNIKKGSQSKNWNGGTTIDRNGYRHINIKGNYILEHRYVWIKAHGELPNNWIIHHLNGNKLDNRLENLTAMSRKIHSPKSIIEPFRKRISELELELKTLKKMA